MLNISVAKDAFEKYVSKYDMTDPKVKLKYHHTYRVCEQSLNISKSLGLNEEETNLAYVIALLHDIGRFRQEEVYHTFNDLKSIDVGDLKNVLKYNEDTDYFGMIYNDVWKNIVYAGFQARYLYNLGDFPSSDIVISESLSTAYTV